MVKRCWTHIWNDGLYLCPIHTLNVKTESHGGKSNFLETQMSSNKTTRHFGLNAFKSQLYFTYKFA